MERFFKLSLCTLTFGSRFCLFTFALLFQTFSPGIFFFSSRRKEKKNTKKKIYVKKGGSFPLSSHSTVSLLALASALLFWTFSPWHLLILKQNINKQKNTKKKKMQKKEGAYLSFFASAFGMKCSLAFFSPYSFNVELSTFLKPCV